jgi:hypothetical protein
MHKLERVAIGSAAFLGGVVSFAANSFATANAAAVTAVTDSTTTLSDTISAALPLILGVTAIMVVIGLTKRLLRKAG